MTRADDGQWYKYPCGACGKEMLWRENGETHLTYAILYCTDRTCRFHSGIHKEDLRPISALEAAILGVRA